MQEKEGTNYNGMEGLHAEQIAMVQTGTKKHIFDRRFHQTKESPERVKDRQENGAWLIK